MGFLNKKEMSDEFINKVELSINNLYNLEGDKVAHKKGGDIFKLKFLENLHKNGEEIIHDVKDKYESFLYLESDTVIKNYDKKYKKLLFEALIDETRYNAPFFQEIKEEMKSEQKETLKHFFATSLDKKIKSDITIKKRKMEINTEKIEKYDEISNIKTLFVDKNKELSEELSFLENLKNDNGNRKKEINEKLETFLEKESLETLLKDGGAYIQLLTKTYTNKEHFYPKDYDKVKNNLKNKNAENDFTI